MGLPERCARFGAGAADGDERLGLAPAAVGGEWRAFEPVPRRGGVGPQLGPRDPADTLVFGLGHGEPAVGVRGDRRRVCCGTASRREQVPGAAEQVSDGVGVAAGAGESGQLRMCAQSLGAELDADLGGPVPACPSHPGVDGVVGVRPAALPERELGEAGVAQAEHEVLPRGGARGGEVLPAASKSPRPISTRRG